MQLGMVGLGRMGANLVRRLMRDGHRCVVFDVQRRGGRGPRGRGHRGRALARGPRRRAGAPARGLADAAGGGRPARPRRARRAPRRATTSSSTAATRTTATTSSARPQLAPKGLHYVDCGTSGGVWGLERGYCLMIGGETDVVRAPRPALRVHRARGGRRRADAGPDATRRRPPRDGYLHCGPSGAGHFVKMVHNGIEYGMMAAIAEGLSILKHADVGTRPRTEDAETTPLRDPAAYAYDIDVAEVAELWRRGSVVGSWLVDLTADALARSPRARRVLGPRLGLGGGTLDGARRDRRVGPRPGHHRVAVLEVRVARRGCVRRTSSCSAMRSEFGGHAERPA